MSSLTEHSWPGLTNRLKLASRLGSRYSIRNRVHLDEAVAEAQFRLVEYWASAAFDIKGDDEAVICRYIRQGLIKYFQGNSKKRRATKFIELLAEPLNEDDLYDVLNEHLDYPMNFMNLILEGMDTALILFLSNDLKCGKVVSQEVSRRIKVLDASISALSELPGLSECT